MPAEETAVRQLLVAGDCLCSNDEKEVLQGLEFGNCKSLDGTVRGGRAMSATSLLTVSDRVALLVNALHPDCDHPPFVKLFTPDGSATWLISESDPDDPDRLFGLCDPGLGCPELGYISLAEITELRGNVGLPVERDRSFVGDKPLSVYAAEARAAGRIIA